MICVQGESTPLEVDLMTSKRLSKQPPTLRVCPPVRSPRKTHALADWKLSIAGVFKHHDIKIAEVAMALQAHESGKLLRTTLGRVNPRFALTCH